MRRRLLRPLIAVALLAYPLVYGPVWMLSGPLYGHSDEWHVEGRVVAVEQQVARFEVQQLERSGTGERPVGTIDVFLPSYLPGVEAVEEGSSLTLAVVAGYEMHDPATEQITFRGYSLEDVKTGCCWSSRIEGIDAIGLLLLLGVLTVGAAWWGVRGPVAWYVATAVATGIFLGLLSGAWANESLTLIQGDGEENWTVSATGVGVLVLAWTGLVSTAWHARLRPLSWAVTAGFVMAYPIAATSGSTGQDVDWAVLALPIPLLCVLMGQREGIWRWVAAGTATAMMLPLAWRMVQAFQSPYDPDWLAGTALMMALAGIFLPVVVDGLWAWRPLRGRTEEVATAA